MAHDHGKVGTVDTTHADDHGDHAHPHEDDHGDHAHPHEDHGHDHGDHGHGHDHGEHGDHVHGTGVWAQIKHAITPHSHDAIDKIQTSEEARADGIRTAWIGLAGMISVALVQIVIVMFSGSIGLLADTVHSFGHAVTTIPLVIAFKLGARKATQRYSYGYRRAEDVAGIFIVFIIFLTSVYIAYEAITALLNPRPLTNLPLVFAMGLVGFLGNEIVAIYRIRGGKRIGSAALIAEGQHARADGFTSLAVAVGITFAWFGFPRADAIVGLFIAVVIFGIMLSSLKSILNRLMDGVDDGLLPKITATVLAVPGVTSGSTRARWSGHRLLVEAYITVDPGLSVGEADAIAAEVREAVRTNIGAVESTTVEINSPALATAVVAEPVHTHA